MVYLTFNECHDGIFKSQVFDVIDFCNEKFSADIRLISFLPITGRGFFRSKRKIIKKYQPNSIVIPILPISIAGWKYLSFVLAVLCWIINERYVIAREVHAAYIAIKAKKFRGIKKVCFDGRGPAVAQQEDYKIYPPHLSKDLYEVERVAVMNSDIQMSVTEEMVDYWRKYFKYNRSDYFVIPCTASSSFNSKTYDRNSVRIKMGFSEEDIVLVFSGSLSGWQSFELMQKFCRSVLEISSNYKILFLAKEEPNILKLISDYPGRVFRAWLNHEEVPRVLYACDYGLLIREDNTTNRTCISTKFAEYLSSGLKIIITEYMAISSFVYSNELGLIVNSNFENLTSENIGIVDWETKQQMMRIAAEHMTKEANVNKYSDIITRLKDNN